ncbi:hypothetical protein EXIGLDRAFT_753300 [Exidia glandulosa HHB12029]|uniref:Uncharacterized protein n=1 Tax=Exidia glandulosa HHB12029 TaxID=1314781 RepID=A0A165ZSD9_EXIGL|nr:hypothetical protein EXIGLDRAFT_753300 [Exidia glandulosa HHB12029]
MRPDVIGTKFRSVGLGRAARRRAVLSNLNLNQYLLYALMPSSRTSKGELSIPSNPRSLNTLLPSQHAQTLSTARYRSRRRNNAPSSNYTTSRSGYPAAHETSNSTQTGSSTPYNASSQVPKPPLSPVPRSRTTWFTFSRYTSTNEQLSNTPYSTGADVKTRVRERARAQTNTSSSANWITSLFSPSRKNGTSSFTSSSPSAPLPGSTASRARYKRTPEGRLSKIEEADAVSNLDPGRSTSRTQGSRLRASGSTNNLPSGPVSLPFPFVKPTSHDGQSQAIHARALPPKSAAVLEDAMDIDSTSQTGNGDGDDDKIFVALRNTTPSSMARSIRYITPPPDDNDAQAGFSIDNIARTASNAQELEITHPVNARAFGQPIHLPRLLVLRISELIASMQETLRNLSSEKVPFVDCSGTHPATALYLLCLSNVTHLAIYNDNGLVIAWTDTACRVRVLRNCSAYVLSVLTTTNAYLHCEVLILGDNLKKPQLAEFSSSYALRARAIRVLVTGANDTPIYDFFGLVKTSSSRFSGIQFMSSLSFGKVKLVAHRERPTLSARKIVSLLTHTISYAVTDSMLPLVKVKKNIVLGDLDAQCAADLARLCCFDNQAHSSSSSSSSS